MNEGWIKLYRRMTEWEWYTNSEMVHLFLHLILKATPNDKIWQGVKICRGQVVTSRQKLSVETGISERSIRTCLNRLKNTSEIEVKTTNKFSIITICKYEDYQSNEIQSDQPTDQQGCTSNDQPTDHNIRRKEYIYNNINNNIISPSSPNGESGAGKTPKKKSTKKKKPEEYTIVTKGRKIYEQFFYDTFSVEYVWSAKDAAVMKAILSKITSSRKAKNMAVDDDSVVSGFSSLLESITDEWILKNLSLDLIVNKYNTIVAQAKANINSNGTREKNNRQAASTHVLAGQSAAVIDDIAKADEYYDNGNK